MSSSSLNISSELLCGMSELIISIVSKAVRHCGEKHNFDAESMLRELNIMDMSLVKDKVVKEKVVKKAVKEVVVKSKYPMPFNGESKEGCCQALRQNHGLYTQCETTVNQDETYCKKCGPSPQFGTIQERLSVGLMEFRDSKGKAPIHFTKVMKKLKISQAEVEEEAGKLNIIINPIHFEEEKIAKKEKGRPKKAKKIVELADDSTDLFAALVAKANEESDDSDSEEEEKLAIAESIVDSVLDKVSVIVENNEKKAEKAAEKAAEKEAEKQKKETEKQALLQKKEADKALKETEKQALLQKKEADKALKEAEKEAAKQKKEADKALKEAEKEAAKQKKEAEKKPVVVKAVEVKPVVVKAVAVKKAKVEEEEEEEDVVKRFEFEGVKYLKSKKTGIIYNMEQDVIGKWNDKTGKIDFEEAGSEEEEEEYEE